VVARRSGRTLFDGSCLSARGIFMGSVIL